jgi:hypothetical protein
LSELERQKQEVIARHGPWTAHNIHLGDGVYTMQPGIVGDEIKLRRVVQTVFDLSEGSVANLRILDLACLEGMYAIELVRHGAIGVGIEGRAANLAKAAFVKEALGLRNLTLHQDDVRNLSRAKYGSFDVVLCLGILYHLDAPDVFTFLQRIAEVCVRFAIIDTHISVSPEQSRSHEGKLYWGRPYVEHAPTASAEEKAQNLWASLDNAQSFWLTRDSLLDALSHAGFTSVLECHLPAEATKPADRITLVAFKGPRQALKSAPLA